jgi:ADP-ribose pyrophosphatase YjhB (NUDIX family)
VEYFDDVKDAIKREKQLKKWSRKKKEALIEKNYWLLQESSRKQHPPHSVVEMTLKLGVDVIIEGDHGTILFVQRKDDGCWSLPGGWVEVGETPDQAAMREVQEETGLHIELFELADVHIRPTGSVHLTYIGRRFSGTILPCSEEADRVEFLQMSDVKKWHADHEERVRRVVRRRVEQ